MPSEFLLAYQELVRLADDDPSDLASRAAEYPALRAACERMERAATGIWIADRYSSVRFAQHVSKAEVAAVADYQNRWQRAVLQTNPFLRDIASVASSPQLKSERDKIRDSLEDGELLARRFEALIDFAREHASPDDESNFWEWAYEAISVWDDLRLRGDFRLASTLAALELLPFVRIPEELSDKHGSAETISLFTKLRDAQRAFVYGCYLSCAAMQRAILEDLLPPKKFDREPVPARLDATKLNLPLRQRLKEINSLANDVLHADRFEQAKQIGPVELIERLVRGLHTLKDAIEAGPLIRSDYK